MHITITHVSQFRDAFHRAGRKDQFSYDGLAVLYEWLDENYPNYELDVVELCCEYAESSADDLADDYSIEIEGDKLQCVVDYVNQHSVVLGVTTDGNIVYSKF